MAAWNSSWQSFATTERKHHKMMAKEQRQYTTEPQVLLDILRWHGSNSWSYPERQTYSDTLYIAETSARTTPYQSYGNGENKAPCMQINIMARY